MSRWRSFIPVGCIGVDALWIADLVHFPSWVIVKDSTTEPWWEGSRSPKWHPKKELQKLGEVAVWNTAVACGCRRLGADGGRMGGCVPKDIGAPTQPHCSALGFPSNYEIWKEIPLLPRKETNNVFSSLLFPSPGLPSRFLFLSLFLPLPASIFKKDLSCKINNYIYLS